MFVVTPVGLVLAPTAQANLATKFVVTAASGSMTAGDPVQLTITAEDNSGAVDTTYSGDKALTFSGASPSANPVIDPTVMDKSGTPQNFGVLTTITFTNGVATAGGMMALYASGTDTITVDDGTLSTSTGNGGGALSMTVNAGPASNLEIGGSTSEFAGNSQQLTLSAVDGFGNADPNYSGDKTVTFFGYASTASFCISASDCVTQNGTAAPASFGGTTPTVTDSTGSARPFDSTNGSTATITFANGVSSAGGLLELVAAQTFTLEATEGSLNAGTLTVDVNGTRLVITGSASQTAGASQQLTITAKDQSNATDTTYTGDHVLVFSGANSSVSPVTAPTVTDENGAAVAFGSDTTITFTNGVATVGGLMHLYEAESATIAVSESGGPSSSGSEDLSVTVSAATATRLVVTGSGTQSSGGSQTVTATATDAFGNTSTSFTGSHTLIFSGASSTVSPAHSPTVRDSSSSDQPFGSPTAMTFSSGVASGLMNLYTVETANVAAASLADSISASGGSDQLTVVVSAGATSASVATAVASPASVVANGSTASTVTVMLKDANGNAVQGHTVTLTAGSGSSQVSSASGSSTSGGVVTFTVTDTTAQAVTYTAQDTTSNVTLAQQPTVTFIAGPTSASVATAVASPASVVANGSTTVTVTLKDANGNAVQGHTVTLTAGSGSSQIGAASGTSTSSGIVTFTITDTSGETVAYTAKDTTSNVTLAQQPLVTFAATVCTVGSVFSNGRCVPIPTVTAISPGAGAPNTSFTVTTSGTNFSPSSTVRVTYGPTTGAESICSNVTVLSATQLVCTIGTDVGLFSVKFVVTIDNVSSDPSIATFMGQLPVCSAGTYLSGSSCVAASPGYFVAAPGATKQVECPDGAYQPSAGQGSCLTAAPGSYVGAPAQTESAPCAVDSFTALAGAASCTPCPVGKTTLGKVGSTGCVSSKVIESVSSGGLCVGDGTLTLTYCPSTGIPQLTVTLGQIGSTLTDQDKITGVDGVTVITSSNTLTTKIGPQPGSNTLTLSVSGQPFDARNSATVSFRAASTAPIIPPVITSLDSSTALGRVVVGGKTVGFTEVPPVGSSILVNGSGFFYTTTLTPGLCSNLFYVTYFQLLCLIAPAASGTVEHVQAFTPGMGQSAPTGFTIKILDVPTLTELTPNYGPAVGGQKVVIHGTGFLPSSTLTPGFASNVEWINDTTIVATVSSGIAPGSVIDVKVTTTAGSSQSLPWTDGAAGSGNDAASSSRDTTIQGTSGRASATVSVPAGALPQGTPIQLTPAPSSASHDFIPSSQTYILSFQVSWQPATLKATSPVTLTVHDPAIKAGDAIWATTSTGLKQVGTAATDGVAVVTFTDDPTFYVTKPRARPAGYSFVTAKGILYRHGKTAASEALPRGAVLTRPIVATASDFAGRGGVRVGSDGGVYAYGDVPFQGSLAHTHLTKPITAVAVTPAGDGYILVGADGRVYPFGKTSSYGSLQGRRLASPVVAAALSIDGKGYLLVQANGTVHAYGDAKTFALGKGSHRPSSVVAVTSTGTGLGYFLVSSNGTVSAFGDARRYGDLIGKAIDSRIVGLVLSPDGKGYDLVASNSSVYPFGDAKIYRGTKPIGPVVAVGYW